MKEGNNTSRSSLTMVLITWIIISLGFFVDTVVAKGKKGLKCWNCVENAPCAQRHENGNAFNCDGVYELLSTGRTSDRELNDYLNGGGAFNPNGGGRGGVDRFWAFAGDYSTNGTEEKSNATARQGIIWPHPSSIFQHCMLKKKNGKVSRSCYFQDNDNDKSADTDCSDSQATCAYCNTDKCNGDGKGGNGNGGKGGNGDGNDDNGSTQLLCQMSTWGVIILSALLTLIPPSLL